MPGKYEVAWDYLESTLTKMVDWTHRTPLFGRKTKEFEFKEEDFRDAVVMPSYRNQGLSLLAVWVVMIV